MTETPIARPSGPGHDNSVRPVAHRATRGRPDATRHGDRHRERGASAIEILFALGIASVIGGTSIGVLSDWRDRARSEGAARLVLQQVRLARAIAVREGVQVGLVFQAEGDGTLVFRMHRDGNGNGIRRAETTRGIDPPLGDVVRVGTWFPGTRLAVARRVPNIDGGPPIEADSDAVRLAGGTDVLSTGPAGTITAGTIYIAGIRDEVFAVRAVAMGGRLRLLEFSPSQGAWLDRW